MTNIEPHRLALMKRYCKLNGTNKSMQHYYNEDASYMQGEPEIPQAQNPVFAIPELAQGEVRWDASRVYGPWYTDFFGRLFHRHMKYRERGIEFPSVGRRTLQRFKEVEKGVNIGDIECLIVDIGRFGFHDGAVGADFLMGTVRTRFYCAWCQS